MATSRQDPLRRVGCDPAMALGMDWLIRLPDGPAKDEALTLLAEATKCAVAAMAG